MVLPENRKRHNEIVRPFYIRLWDACKYACTHCVRTQIVLSGATFDTVTRPMLFSSIKLCVVMRKIDLGLTFNKTVWSINEAETKHIGQFVWLSNSKLNWYYYGSSATQWVFFFSCRDLAHIYNCVRNALRRKIEFGYKIFNYELPNAMNSLRKKPIVGRNPKSKCNNKISTMERIKPHLRLLNNLCVCVKWSLFAWSNEMEWNVRFRWIEALFSNQQVLIFLPRKNKEKMGHIKPASKIRWLIENSKPEIPISIPIRRTGVHRPHIRTIAQLSFATTIIRDDKSADWSTTPSRAI